MSIYSNNRSGSMELDQIAANESYTCNDFGRILYESQLNDMAFFEAVLACDFKEAKGLQEGTILQSEVKAMNEASFKAIVDKVVDRLKAFWAKIQGAFKDAIDKISAYVLGDGKAFVREFNKAVEKRIGSISNWDGSVNVTLFDLSSDVFDYNADVFGYQAQIWAKQPDVKTTEVISMFLNDKSVKEFPKYALETAKTDATMNKTNVGVYTGFVESAKDYIAKLRDAEKKAKASINDAIKSIKAMDNTEADRLNKMVSVFETVAVVKTRTKIAAVKLNMKNSRKALSDALASMKANAKNEAVYIDDIDLVFAN